MTRKKKKKNMEKPDEQNLKLADELLNKPDREVLALALGKNEKWSENYLTAMIIKLRSSVDYLEQNIKKSSKSQEKHSQAMIWLTVALVIVPFISLFLILLKDANLDMKIILGIIAIILAIGFLYFMGLAQKSIFGGEKMNDKSNKRSTFVGSTLRAVLIIQIITIIIVLINSYLIWQKI